LLIDYYGFPDYTYKLEYNVPHSPQLVGRIKQLLSKDNIEIGENDSRGLDHGVFIPLKLMYSDANIPVVQLSLNANLDPMFHFKLGQSLSVLREEGTLILGSGSITHNLRMIGNHETSWVSPWLNYVSDSLTNPNYNLEKRKEKLIDNIKHAPNFAKAHPRTEHWIPFYVAMGAAWQENFKAEQIFDKLIDSLSLDCWKFY